MIPEPHARVTFGPASAASETGSWPLADDPRVVRALEGYLDDVAAGKRPSREELLARHPDVAGPLGACLDGLDFLRSAARNLSSPERLLGPRDRLAPATCLGDYRIVREVGRGGMGVVYEAEQISLSRRVALKVLPLAAAIDPKQRQRFHVEAQAAAHLHHPNIVPIFAVGSDGGSPFYAMQFIEGRTLSAAILEMRRFGGMSRGGAFLASRIAPSPGDVPPPSPVDSPFEDPLDSSSDGSTLAPRGTDGSGSRSGNGSGSSGSSQKGRDYYRTVARLGVEAAEALEHAHGLGVLHRDIKPANLLIDGRGKLWVTDFGLARFRDDPGPTRTGDLLGTLRYMSPEQVEARRGVVDQRSDVYALGATLYEALTLRPAVSGRDRAEILARILSEEPVRPRKIHPDIPRDLETIILKAMAKEPAHRYSTAQDLADDLRRFLDDRAILACPPSPVDRAVRWVRKHMTVVITGATILMATTTVSTIVVLAQQRVTSKALEDTKQALEHAKADRALADKTLDRMLVATNNLAMRAMATITDYCESEVRPQDVEFIRLALDFYADLERSLKTDRRPERREILAKAYFGLGLTRWLLREPGAADDYTRSANHYQALANEQPGRTDLLFHQAASLKYLGILHESAYNPAEAERVYLRLNALERQLVEREPGNPAYQQALVTDLVGLAKVQQRLGVRDEAEKNYREILRRRPGLPVALNNYAWLLVSDPDLEPYDPKRAVAMVREALKARPEEANFLNTLGLALIRTGDLDGATRALQDSMRLNRKYPGGTPTDWFLLALVRAKSGDRAGALDLFHKAQAAMTERPADSELLGFHDEAADVLGIRPRPKRPARAVKPVPAADSVAAARPSAVTTDHPGPSPTPPSEHAGPASGVSQRVAPPQ